MSPGPSLAVVIRQTIAGSRVHGVATALSHAVGIGIYALLTAFGLAALLTANPMIYRVLALGGAGYLLGLGLGALRSDGGVAASADGQASSRVLSAARDGFAISLLNPKIIIFFLALFSQFIKPGMGAGSQALISVTAMAIDASWYMLVAVALSHAGIWDVLRRQSHWIDRITGGVLIALAVVTFAEFIG